MPKFKITPERALSNRNHHLTHWLDIYAEEQRKVASDCIRLLRIAKRLQESAVTMKKIDINRRENAFNMGVPLGESDAAYSFEELIRSIPDMIRNANKQLEGLGLSYAAFVGDDKGEL